MCGNSPCIDYVITCAYSKMRVDDGWDDKLSYVNQAV